MFPVMGDQIRDGLRYLNTSADVDAQDGDGTLGIAAAIYLHR